MQEYSFRTVDGANVGISVENPNLNAPSLYLFGVVKGGSTLLSKIGGEIAARTPYRHIDVDKLLFDKGYHMPLIQEDVSGLINKQGCIYGSFRWMPPNLAMPYLESKRKVLLLRDPRDMMVSLYFSMKYSHKIPDEGPMSEAMSRNREQLQSQDINDFVLSRINYFGLNYFRTLQIKYMDNTMFRRYEDIIFNKEKFVSDICEFSNINLSDEQICEIAAEHDIVPDQEQVGQHVRNVKPGNFREKLEEETIQIINNRLFGAIRGLGYDF